MQDNLAIIFCEELLERLLEKLTSEKSEPKSDLSDGVVMGYCFSMTSVLNLAFSLGILDSLDKKWQDLDPERLV